MFDPTVSPCFAPNVNAALGEFVASRKKVYYGWRRPNRLETSVVRCENADNVRFSFSNIRWAYKECGWREHSVSILLLFVFIVALSSWSYINLKHISVLEIFVLLYML